MAESSKPSDRAATPTLLETLRYTARVGRLLGPYWPALARTTLLGLCLGATSMLVPYISKALIDEAYPARDVQLVSALVLGMAVVLISSAFMNAARGYFTQTISAEITSVTSQGFFNHLQHLPQPFHTSHQVGEVLSRVGDMRSGVGTVISTMQTLLSSGLYLILVPPFLLLLNVKLTLLALIVVPLTATVSTVGARVIRRYARETAEAGAELHAYQVEVLMHIGNLKSMAMEPHVFARQQKLSERLVATSLRSARAQTVISLVNSLLRTGGQVLFMSYAWTMIIRSEFSLGSYIAFTAYLAYLTGPVGQVTSLFTSLQTAGVALGRMFEYLDMPVEQDPSHAYRRHLSLERRLHGDLAFRHVWFGYDTSRPVLRDITLELEGGTVVALVGPSGSGKSTLLRLIPRLLEPTRGTVLVDGITLRDLPLADLRRQVAAVWQGFSLMRGSVWDNLTMGDPDVGRNVVIKAIEVCCLEEFVSGLPHGLDAPVGEWGSALSEGQRQRLAIARALVRATPVLLLDEVTANLDPDTENQLITRLFAAYPNKTILMVTHRHSTAARAQRIITMQDGRLVEGKTPHHQTDQPRPNVVDGVSPLLGQIPGAH